MDIHTIIQASQQIYKMLFPLFQDEEIEVSSC